MSTKTDAVTDSRRRYLPAAGIDFLLPFYDPVVKLFGGDRVRRRLLDEARIRAGHDVLDIGCGTGTLVALAKRLYPDARVVGLDPDPKALVRAQRKAANQGLSIRLDQGYSDRLPYDDASFDRVLSSMMFHHLTAEEKQPTLREVRRVLRPGGSLHLVDFGGPGEGHGLLLNHFHRGHDFADNAQAHILDLIERAGLVAKPPGYETMLVGRVILYEAVTTAR
jgi:ubiquinone/menaquinone biosynthesis C-methylase UbiE